MPLHDLPLEVKTMILGAVPLTERLPLRLVCSEFNQAVVLSVRGNPLEKLAFKVAQECHEGPIGPYSRIRSEISKTVTATMRTAEFNDCLIAAFMELGDINVGVMRNWLNQNLLLRNGPTNVNAVQLAEQLGLFYDQDQ